MVVQRLPQLRVLLLQLAYLAALLDGSHKHAHLMCRKCTSQNANLFKIIMCIKHAIVLWPLLLVNWNLAKVSTETYRNFHSSIYALQITTGIAKDNNKARHTFLLTYHQSHCSIALPPITGFKFNLYLETFVAAILSYTTCQCPPADWSELPAVCTCNDISVTETQAEMTVLSKSDIETKTRKKILTLYKY